MKYSFIHMKFRCRAFHPQIQMCHCLGVSTQGFLLSDHSPKYLATELRHNGKHGLILSMGINKRLYGACCLTLCHSMRPGPFEEAQQHFSGVVTWFGW